jgi:hypothetical protein
VVSEGVTEYLCRNTASGEEKWYARSALRHRKLHTEAFTGVTGDRKHDSYSMRHFSHMEFRKLAERGVFRDQLITTIATHSDNAAQHFRSAKTLNWYTSLLDESVAGTHKDDSTTPAPSKEGAGLLYHLSEGKIKALVWDTGCPGHGKGVWDGLFGVQKTYLRNVVIAAQGDKVTINATVIRSPWDCFEQLRKHFDTEDWRQRQDEKGRPMARITLHWAGMNDETTIKRPAKEEKYHGVEHISSSHQFFVISTGRLAARRHSCWCPACHTNIAKGGADGQFQRNYRFPGCVHAAREPLYRWSNESCAQIGGGSIQAAWAKTRIERAKTAKTVTPGEWCVLLAPDDEDEEFWLARAVAVDDWGGACCRLHNCTKHVNGNRFDKGDVEIAVQWYGTFKPHWCASFISLPFISSRPRTPTHLRSACRAGRVAGSMSPRKYQIEEKQPIASVNSTILLAKGDVATHVGGPKPRTVKARGMTAKKKEAAEEAQRTWGLVTSAETAALMGRYQNQRE